MGTQGGPACAARGESRQCRVRNDSDDLQTKGGGLRNTIYQQQTRSGRQLTRTRLMLYRAALPVVIFLVGLVWRWSRVVRVDGAQYIAESLRRAPSFIPVYWHQHGLFCARQLLDMRAAGVKLGLLISPSVDGEFGAMLFRRLGAEVIRGSSTHTGARTLRDFYQALTQQDISPAMAPDGPRGPVHKFKPGAVLLAQLSQRPIIPLAFAASHAWRIGWDGFVLPMPGARVAICVGEPVYVTKGLDAAGIERMQLDMESRMQTLSAMAHAALEKP